jgi:hypothetical protein
MSHFYARAACESHAFIEFETFQAVESSALTDPMTDSRSLDDIFTSITASALINYEQKVMR